MKSKPIVIENLKNLRRPELAEIAGFKGAGMLSKDELIEHISGVDPSHTSHVIPHEIKKKGKK